VRTWEEHVIKRGVNCRQGVRGEEYIGANDSNKNGGVGWKNSIATGRGGIRASLFVFREEKSKMVPGNWGGRAYRV